MPPRSPIRAPRPTRSTSRDLGVRYSLRFTRKTTLRQSLARMLRRDDRPTDVLGAPRRLASGSSTASRSAVIGPNGAGKSTLLQVLAGIITPSEGEVDVRGHDLDAADARRRLRPGPDRPRQHPAGGRVPRASTRSEMARRLDGDHRVRRHRPVHRRADQDVLVGHAGPARVRDRDVGRPGHPAARRGPRDRRRRCSGRSRRQRVLELVQGGQGDRPRDPRHELGHRVLQPGDPAREGPVDRRGRAGRGRRASTRSTPSGRRRNARRRWIGRSKKGASARSPRTRHGAALPAESALGRG